MLGKNSWTICANYPFFFSISFFFWLSYGFTLRLRFIYVPFRLFFFLPITGIYRPHTHVSCIYTYIVTSKDEIAKKKKRVKIGGLKLQYSKLHNHIDISSSHVPMSPPVSPSSPYITPPFPLPLTPVPSLSLSLSTLSPRTPAAREASSPPPREGASPP